MDYKKQNYITAGVIFILSSIVYLITMQPNLSFWDCGEFAACAYTLSVPHPPGAPLWTLIGKVATLLPIGSNPAVKINAVSAISSGFTVMLLYLVLVMVIKSWKGKPDNNWDAFTIFGSSAIGALSYAFCDSFWFNALESEVYSFGTLLVALCVWLIIYWHENADKEGSGKIMLLFAFISGLALGIHLLVIQVILAAGLIYYFRKYEFSRKGFLIAFLITCGAFLIVYPVITLWYPSWLAGDLGLFKIKDSTVIKWIAILIIPALIYGTIRSLRKKEHTKAFIFSSILLVFLGYSIYTSVLLRARVDNLPINENEPGNMQNLVSYLNREQYGNAPFWPRRYSHEPMHNKTWVNYSSDLDFMWRYQINLMFNRYLGWQYIGRAGYNMDQGIDWKKLYGIPFLLGLIGLFYHFRKDWKLGLSFLWLFLLTGVLSALFQRQQDPQPRERDYFYEGAFFVYSMWIGIGVMGIIELISSAVKNKVLVKSFGIIVLLGAFIFVPVNMFRVNYHYQNRHSDYLPFDNAYNILQSLDKDAIVFTNGDNDTFPIWYLQSVGYRPDVRVVNLSLLQMPWYIKQLKNSSPYGALKVPINLTDQEIEGLQPTQWGDFKPVSIEVPAEAYPDSMRENQELPDKLSWKMPATISEGKIKGVRVSDLMVFDIIRSNQWRRPVYFSVSVSKDNYIGLDDYLIQDGMAKRLVPFKDESGKQFRVSDLMFENLLNTPTSHSKTPQHGFFFRGLDDPGIFYDETHTNIVQSYRSQYLVLAYSYFNTDNDKAAKVLARMEENMPENIVPMDYRIQFDVAKLYGDLGDKNNFDRLSPDVEKTALEELKRNPTNTHSYYNPYRLLIDIYDERKDYNSEIDILTRLEKVMPGRPEISRKIELLKARLEGDQNENIQEESGENNEP
ncbi:MAG: DUF2723 domain-containing protein [Ignavibacteria bacterium]|jgi:hypothetical protein